jgi:hypothetical protein
VGLLSDWFNHGLGLGSAQGVRWALIVSTLFGLVAVLDRPQNHPRGQRKLGGTS